MITILRDKSFDTPIPNERTNAGYSIVILKSALTKWGVFVHEIGHTFTLDHPFGDEKKNTTNYMDTPYTPQQNMFWQWQWKIINKIDF